jgi:glycosyltransferase involved in cell wall biosynthesis
VGDDMSAAVAGTGAADTATDGRDRGLVMVCDVDLGVPDGARSHTAGVAEGFARTGLHVELIARGPDPELSGVTFRPAQGAEHDRIRIVTSLGVQTISALWRERRRARRLYVRHKWSTMPPTIVGRLLGYRIVTEVDDLPYGPSYEYPIRWYVDWFKRGVTWLMGRLSHGIVAGTAEARDLLADEFHVPRERIGIVPIGVDVDYFAPGDRDEAVLRAGLDPDCRYVVFLGHFQHWVDFDTLLGAFAIVARRAPQARLLLVGDGGEREAIEARVAAEGIADRVTLTGFVRDRDAVRDLLACATVLLASHRAEYLDRIGMNATKIAEYLASGRAVVAKDVARLREMIDDTGAGRVVPQDPEAMAEAILDLLEPERADAMGRAGRHLAVERYSWESTIRRTLALF